MKNAMRRKRNSENSENNSNKNETNTIMLVDRDIIRKLIIPQPKTNNKAVVLSSAAYDKIKENSTEIPHYLYQTKTDNLEAALQEEILKEETLKKEIESLKNSRTPDKVDEEEQRNTEYILARTEELKREQEDIVKKCNSLILSIKCKAIQDTQIAEKELIKEEFRQHESIRDDMMEKERKRAMQDIQKKREQDWARKQKYAACILEQIQENEKHRLQEMERLQREFKLLKLRAEHQTCERSENLQREFALRIELKKQNEQINERIKREKELEREREKLENIKIQQLVKRKLEEEKESEERNKKERQRRERELARLWKIQKSSRSLLQWKDDIIAERIQEQHWRAYHFQYAAMERSNEKEGARAKLEMNKMQRKWRERELETVLRKRRETEELKSAREQQIREKREGKATLICQKEKEAEKNKLESEKLRNELLQLQCNQKQMTDKHKNVLQNQIIDKELKKRKQRDEALKERQNVSIRLQQQDRIINETLRKKIDQIRSCNLPDMYVKHLEKHLSIAANVHQL